MKKSVLLVTCQDNKYKDVMKEAKKLEGFISAFRVEKKSKSNIDLVINLYANEERVKKIIDQIRQKTGVTYVKGRIEK